MPSLQEALYEVGRVDQLAAQDTWVHRLDARVKVLVTLAFVVCVVSFDRYAFIPLLPFALFPVIMASEGRIPLRWIGQRLVEASPFALLVGILNPLLDPAVVATVGTLEVTGGWASYLSIIVRFLLTTAAALVLVATTGFHGVCNALERMGVPDVFAVQLLFLYRYIFVLAEEAVMMSRARDLRSFGRRGTGIAVYGQILGHLLLRTYARARRVHDAMVARGFDGRVRVRDTLAIEPADLLFLAVCAAFLLTARLVDIPVLIGSLFV